MKCAECEEKNCLEKSECTENRENFITKYKEEDRKILEKAYEVSSEAKGKLNRIEELVLFCKKMNYNKIGLAFCKGLAKEGKKINDLLKEHFEVVSICCKFCDISKDDLNVKSINDGKEIACNPLGQAYVLNKEEVDFAIMVGFCLGHDVIFLKNIKAPVTTLIVKDKVFKHKTIEVL